MTTPLTGEIARIHDELSRAYDGEPWHGPSLREVLRGVSAEADDSLRNGDAPRLREAAHKLCGLLSVFSTAAAAVASDLEDQAAGGQLDAARLLSGRLKAMAADLVREVDGTSLESLRRRAGVSGG